MTEKKRGRGDSKSLLVEAALEVIETEGVNAVRLDTILASVGLTKGSLYWHFKDRDDLIRAALQEQMRRVFEKSLIEVSDAIASASNLVEYLAQVQSVIADPYNPDEVRQRWRRLELMVAARNDPHLAEVMADIQIHGMSAYTQLMADAQARGILRSELDPAAVALAINSMAVGANVLISLMGEDAPKRESWFELMAFLITALAPPNSLPKD